MVAKSGEPSARLGQSTSGTPWAGLRTGAAGGAAGAGRVWRVTSTRPVTIYCVLHRGTIEQTLFDEVSTKQDAATICLHGHRVPREFKPVDVAEVLAQSMVGQLSMADAVSESPLLGRWQELRAQLSTAFRAASMAASASRPRREAIILRFQPSTPVPSAAPVVPLWRQRMMTGVRGRLTQHEPSFPPGPPLAPSHGTVKGVTMAGGRVCSMQTTIQHSSAMTRLFSSRAFAPLFTAAAMGLRVFSPLHSFVAAAFLSACVMPRLCADAPVVLSSPTPIAEADTSYDGLDLLVSNTVVTIDAPHSFNSLLLTNGAGLTQSPCATPRRINPISATEASGTGTVCSLLESTERSS